MPSFPNKAKFPNSKVLSATDKALLIEIDGEEHWIPHSQIDDDSEVYDNKGNAEGTLVISSWIAQQKKLV